MSLSVHRSGCFSIHIFRIVTSLFVVDGGAGIVGRGVGVVTIMLLVGRGVGGVSAIVLFVGRGVGVMTAIVLFVGRGVGGVGGRDGGRDVFENGGGGGVDTTALSFVLTGVGGGVGVIDVSSAGCCVVLPVPLTVILSGGPKSSSNFKSG